ncbi:unnamed protein product [Adineta steineri]|uniref:G-protein coupled receptors family 1 profile domain-containing protein n=2 Tax=Adineta steineri TaxID=433720 RepID=A0A814UIV8_9BILA|nr:unnamed protein product [Adineta steineri]CAF3820538.1 unnamed protein product [Adineta steineri]
MSDELIQTLDFISKQFNRYLATIIFLFGVIGNILNCLVLSQRRLRLNPCATLFLISSFIDLISIVVGLTTRILAGWNLDPTTSISWICKIRTFITFSTRTLAIWIIMLAAVDRWLLSSMDFHRRQLSSLKNIKLGIIFSFIVSILSYIHMLYCYDANRIDGPLKCYGKSEACRFSTDLIYSIITILIPSIIMIVFGIMIVSNVHYLRIRTHAMTITSIILPLNARVYKLKKTDHQLLRMLLVQAFLLTIFCIPQAIQKFYITFRPFNTISKTEDAIVLFLYNIEVLLAFIASGMPFYLYTLTGGTVFRKASRDLMRKMHRSMKCSS